jgi:outer membrane protein assembly factor BamB
MHRIAIFMVMFAIAATAYSADTPLITGTMEGRTLVGGSGRVMILGPAGEILWEQKTALTHDAWMLPTGNVLYADGASVTEVTPEKKVVFQHKAGNPYSCQRLANGNTMVAENATGKVLEVDPTDKEVFSLQISPVKPGDHHNMRMARKLENGNYLVCHSGPHIVKEYTPKGEVVLEIKEDNIAFAAIRTPQNTTLVSSLGHIREYDAKGTKIWEFTNSDVPEAKINAMTGMQLLANGNIAVGCYSSYNKQGEGSGLFEITREKKLVWRYSNPKADGSTMAIQRLDKDGKPLAGPSLR